MADTSKTEDRVWRGLYLLVLIGIGVGVWVWVWAINAAVVSP